MLSTLASARRPEAVAEARRDVAARGTSRAAGSLHRAAPLGYGPAGPRFVDGIFQCRLCLVSGRRGVRSLALVRGVAPRPRAGVRGARAQRAQGIALRAGSSNASTRTRPGAPNSRLTWRDAKRISRRRRRRRRRERTTRIVDVARTNRYEPRSARCARFRLPRPYLAPRAGFTCGAASASVKQD